MAINRPNVAEWENIFLDTSVLINLLLYKIGSTDRIAVFTHQLISFLSNNKRLDGRTDRSFFISSISLSEILSEETEDGRIKELVTAIGSKDVEIIAYDEIIALQVAKEIGDHLQDNELNRFAKEIGWKTHELHLAREWISRDFMIAMSGKNRSVDVLLTTDKRTFLPICNEIDVFCALCEPELYNYNDTFIFEYYIGKVNDFVNDKKESGKPKQKA